jgi:hypothetical protein
MSDIVPSSPEPDPRELELFRTPEIESVRDLNIRRLVGVALTEYFASVEHAAVGGRPIGTTGTEAENLFDHVPPEHGQYSFELEPGNKQAGIITGRWTYGKPIVVATPESRGPTTVTLETALQLRKRLLIGRTGLRREIATATSMLANNDLPVRQREKLTTWRSHLLDVPGEPTRRFWPLYLYDNGTSDEQLRRHMSEYVLKGASLPAVKAEITAVIQDRERSPVRDPVFGVEIPHLSENDEAQAPETPDTHAIPRELRILATLLSDSHPRK